MTRDNRVKKIDIRILPTPNEAAELLRGSGGSLMDPSDYGSDPIANDLNKSSIRERHFLEKYNFTVIFSELVNAESHTFEKALLYYIVITKRLS